VPAAVATPRVKLWELTTPTAGYFYTASQTGKDNAVAKYGFKVTGADLGYLAIAQTAGTAPLFAFGAPRVGHTSSPSAPASRTNSSPQGILVYEGVIGYGATLTCGGEAETLWRVTNNGVWRLAWTTNMIGIVNSDGWRLDGPALLQRLRDRQPQILGKTQAPPFKISKTLHWLQRCLSPRSRSATCYIVAYTRDGPKW